MRCRMRGMVFPLVFDECKLTKEVCDVVCNQVGGDAILLAARQDH